MKPTLYVNNDSHSLAIYTKGNKANPAVIFLHGGPGGAISEASFSFFDETKYFIIAFDQRGCGNSKPFASLYHNTVFDSVSDIEEIRKYFGLDSFIIFGGSYGTTLGLSYAIKYPSHVKAMVLRGIFLGRKEDISWLYQEGASYYYPIEHQKFKNFLNENDQKDIIKGYYKIFSSNDEESKKKACKIWSSYEASLTTLIPKVLSKDITNYDISIALLECHYFKDTMFNGEDNYILNNIDKIKEIPTFIVHGRYDIDCRPIGAILLHQNLKNSNLYLPIAGHSPYDEENFKKLVSIMKEISDLV